MMSQNSGNKWQYDKKSFEPYTQTFFNKIYKFPFHVYYLNRKCQELLLYMIVLGMIIILLISRQTNQEIENQSYKIIIFSVFVYFNAFFVSLQITSDLV